MSQFTITCQCGEQFHLDGQSVGRRVKCRCGRVMEVRRKKKSFGTRLARAMERVGRAATAILPRRTVVARPVVTSRSTRLLAIAAWIYLGAVCAIAGIMWGLGDRSWFGTALLFIGRWIFLLPLVALVPLAFLWSRRSLVSLTFAAFIVLGPIMGMHTGWHRVFGAPNGFKLRMATFNAAGGVQLVGDIPNTMSALGADVLVIQECGAALAESLKEVSGWYHHDAVGLCLISRFPIRDTSVMDRSTLEAIKRGSDIGGSGAVVRYVLVTPNGPIQVTNLHLETPRKGLEHLRDLNVATLRQNTYLRDIESDLARRWVDAGIASERLPLIVAGDFNTPVESHIFQSHWGDLTDAFSRVGIGLGMSKYNGWIRVRIDHVLTNGDWHVSRAFVGDDLGSDHRPVVADLVLNR
jgi:vancomycin resistance protein VanJ